MVVRGREAEEIGWAPFGVIVEIRFRVTQKGDFILGWDLIVSIG